MVNKEHLEVLLQGISLWNKWKNETFEETLDQSTDIYILHENIDLSGAFLCGKQLPGIDFSGVNLSGANLSGANLYGANLSGTNLHEADLSDANFNRADLHGADLSYARMIGTNFEQAILTGCRVYGVSGWDLKLSGAVQNGLIVDHFGRPSIIVDHLEFAQFIYALLDHKKMRDVINSLTGRCVLILGRFKDGGIEVLQSVAGKLREMNYLPLIFDFDKPFDRDYTETITILVGLSKFVIVDLSGPSVPHELYAVVPHFNIPFVPIIEESRKKYSMFQDLRNRYDWVLEPLEFRNKKHLVEMISSRVIEPAEEWHKEKGKTC